jgi:hypothetical protein
VFLVSINVVKNVPVNYAIRFSGSVTALTARRVVSSDSAMLHPSFILTLAPTIHIHLFHLFGSEEQFLMSSRDTRSAAGSAGDSAAEPAASRSPASVPPTSQKRKASQLSTSSQMPSNPLMAPPPRRSRRVNKEDPEPGSLPSPRPRRRQAKQPKAMATSG